MELFQFSFDEGKPYEVLREYSLDSWNKPDFKIITNGKAYIIESKLDDTNYHIDEYAALLKPKNLAGFGL